MHDWAELFADVLILSDYRIVRSDRSVIELTEPETLILGVLAQARGAWKSKQVLAAEIYRGRVDWAASWAVIVRQHIASLREKIAGCSFGIETDVLHRDLGYRLTGHLRVVT